LQRPRRSALIAVQIAFAAAVAWFAGRAIRDQWARVEQAQLSLDPSWAWVILSAAIVLATYLLLVQVWILHLRDWGYRLPFRPAARIWFISNLGRYVPGKVVGLGTMAVLAERRGVSAVAAVASSVVVMLIGIAAGLAVVVVTGAGVAEAVLAGSGFDVPRWTVPAVMAAAVVGLLTAPVALPTIAAIASRMAGRDSVLPTLPAASVWLIAAGSGLSWILYGLAFEMFAIGMLGRVAGGPAGYIAVYTASYLAGLLSLIPGGFVVREATLVLGLTALHLVSAPEAALLALTSRVWLTILEVLPGALFLLTRTEGHGSGRGPRPAPHPHRADAS
jgi:glycosyltransferase 2 family protein